jgi:D-alanyl-D-alanine carboxypeptidase
MVLMHRPRFAGAYGDRQALDTEGMAGQHRHGGLWRRAGFAALLAALALATVLPTPAVQAAGKSAVLVIDGNTGRVLHESAADELRHPASLTKMMTLYMAFELIEQGRLGYQTKIKISAVAAATAPTKLDLDEGQEIALIDAIKALITKSANDMAVAIAEHIAGSEERFAALMTQKARRLGMTSTVFKNASGLPDDEQVTTARDMVTLALRLQDDFPKHYPLFATRTFTYNGETLQNHNSLLSNFEGTDGIKTGYTRASGFNLVSSVHRGGKHVVGAIFGGASARSRDAAMRTFLSVGLVRASTVKTRKPSASLVAQARPAPKIGAVPTPRRIEPPAQPIVTASAPAPAPPPPLPVAVEPTTEPVRPPAIEIARVRSVLVSPRAPTPAPLPLRGSTVPGAEDAIARADSPSPPRPAADEPLSPPKRWTTASAGPIAPMHVAAPAERPAALSGDAAGPGTPPSTLQAQAASLSRGEPPVPDARVPAWQTSSSPPPAVPSRRPLQTAAVQPAAAAAPAAAATPGAFHIQIGAYQSQAEAEKRLASAREQAPGVLANRAPVTTQFKQGDKLYFRARYAGFDAKTAASACSELKRLKIDCLAMKAE